MVSRSKHKVVIDIDRVTCGVVDNVVKVKSEVVDKVSSFVTASFSLVAALAWNSAIQAFFQKYFTSPNGLFPMVLYAVTVTFIAVLATITITKVSEKVK